MVIFDIPKTVFHQRYEFEIEKIKIKYTGEWRKGIAIGYGSNPLSYQDIPYLITKDKVLYRGENDYYHVDEIYRTSEGYYLVYCYRDCSAPGKDSDYRGPFLKCVISEDGKTRISPYEMRDGDMNTGWCDSNNKRVFVPREMGMGIVEFENSFYRLEDFKKLYEIPSKFKIESIFERKLCLLSIPEDNRDFIVTVKNGIPTEYVEVNNIKKLVKLIEKTDDTSLINFCTNNNSLIRVIKKQQDTIENHLYFEKCQRLKDVVYYSEYSYSWHYISDFSITAKEFEDSVTQISNKELTCLKKMHTIIAKEGENDSSDKYIIRMRKVDLIPDHALGCMFYKDFMILRFGGNKYDERKMFRFYSLDGKCLSEKVFKNVQSTKEYRKIEEDKNFNNHIFHYSNDRKDCGIIVIKEGKLYDNKFPEFMFNPKTYSYDISVDEFCIYYKRDRYDFFFNKIKLNYVDIEIEEVIKKYLYRMKPEFDCYISDIINNHYTAKEKYIDGELCYPIPDKLNSIKNELIFKGKNVPNFIKGISHINDYEDDNGETYSLYLFKCRPHAYCTSKGEVNYNFNPDKIVL